jgi:hypothetical protein
VWGRLAWITGGIVVTGAYAWRKLRAPYAEPEGEAPAEADTRADELRRRLEESRALVEERDDFEAGETPLDSADPDERRRSVHEQGRAAVDEMRGEDG